jgi:hypothetical protein
MWSYRSFVITGLALCLGLAGLSLTPRAQAQTRVSKTQAQTATATPRLLEKQLPPGVEGVELKENGIALKAGFKFVKGPNNTVRVASLRPGSGVTGTFDCKCVLTDTNKQKSGTCPTNINGPLLTCTTGTCGGNCDLDVTVGVTRTALMRFAQ